MRIFNLLNSFFVNRGKQFVTYYDDDDELCTRSGRFVTMCRNFVRGKHCAFRNRVCLVYQYNTCYFVVYKLKIAFAKLPWIGTGLELDWNWIGLELDWKPSSLRIRNHHPYGLERIPLTGLERITLTGWNPIILTDRTKKHLVLDSAQYIYASRFAGT